MDEKLVKAGYAKCENLGEEFKIDVDIQSNIEKIKEEKIDSMEKEERKNNIIGIALTVKNIDWNNEDSTYGSEKQIPDMNISYDNYFYIVEVKKTDEDCQPQLKNYMSILGADENKCVSITWDDVIEVLERAVDYGYADVIIKEFLEYIRNHFPNLFSYRSLKYSSTFDEEQKKILCGNRIGLAFTNIEKIDQGKNLIDIRDRQIFFKKNSFQQRIEWWVTGDKLYFMTWLADTGSQMWNFKEFFAKKQFKTLNEKQKTEKYIKFANCGNWLYSFDLDKEFNETIQIYEKLYEITGRLKGQGLKKSIEEILKITGSEKVLDDDERVKEYIGRNVNKDISVGIKLTDYISLSDLIKLESDNFDKNMKPEDDKVAQYIYNYIIDNLIFEK